MASVQARQLVYQKEDHTKMFVGIGIAVVVGLVLLVLTAYYLIHVIHP